MPRGQHMTRHNASLNRMRVSLMNNVPQVDASQKVALLKTWCGQLMQNLPQQQPYFPHGHLAPNNFFSRPQIWAVSYKLGLTTNSFMLQKWLTKLNSHLKRGINSQEFQQRYISSSSLIIAILCKIDKQLNCQTHTLSSVKYETRLCIRQYS